MKTIRDARGIERWLAAIGKRRLQAARTAARTAARIVAQVRKSGDDAVATALRAFDGVDIAASEILTAPRTAAGAAEVRGAVDVAIERVTRFHERQRIDGYRFDFEGSEFRHDVRPLRRVGIYVPGGKAVYLSTLIMCAVPARLAGVAELVVATTPAAWERDELHEACRALGVREIYRAGGPAGIAALALGTGTLPRVDKIVGPGNAYVTAAKQLLCGEVGIDMTAGPTEIVVVADETADAAWIAGDLLAQAEHGDDSSPVCIARTKRVATAIADAVTRALQSLTDVPAARAAASIARNGAILVIDDDDAIAAIVNRLGPEHVSLQLRDPEPLLARIENCGAVYVGAFAAVAAGDYTAGPNHVLPTAGTGRFFSPLGVYDFYKRRNIVRLSRQTFDAIAGATRTLATFEGLPLHARSIAVREVTP